MLGISNKNIKGNSRITGKKISAGYSREYVKEGGCVRRRRNIGENTETILK